MPINPDFHESRLELDMVSNEGDLFSEIDEMEREDTHFVTITTSLASWPWVSPTLCRLRAGNIAALLLWNASEAEPSSDMLGEIFESLNDWDQLLIHNILAIARSRIPEVFSDSLFVEAKTELKWFKEWLQATSDPRIHKYPILPWRSFIRKISRENYEITKAILESASSNDEKLALALTQFLTAKRKVLVTFPKRWSRMQ